jgi:hypothetical protein
MNAEQRFQTSEDVVAREVGGEMVLLDLNSGLYFGLDPVGSRIWDRLCTGDASIAELTDVIEEEFDAPRERIEQDIAALIDQLVERQLVSSLTA